MAARAKIPTIKRGRGIGVAPVRGVALPRPATAAAPALAAANVALGAADQAFAESARRIELEQQASYNQFEAETNSKFTELSLEHEKAGPGADPAAFAARWQEEFSSIQSRIPTESVRLQVERFGNRRFAAKDAQLQADALGNAQELNQQNLDTADSAYEKAFAAAGSDPARMVLTNAMKVSHLASGQATGRNEADIKDEIEQNMDAASRAAMIRMTLDNPHAALRAFNTNALVTEGLSAVNFELGRARAQQAVDGEVAKDRAVQFSLLKSEAAQIQLDSFDSYREKLLTSLVNGVIDKGQVVTLDAFARKSIADREATTVGVASIIAAFSGEGDGFLILDNETKKAYDIFSERAVEPQLARDTKALKDGEPGAAEQSARTNFDLAQGFSNVGAIPRRIGKWLRAGARSTNPVEVEQTLSLIDAIDKTTRNGGPMLADPEALSSDDRLRLELIRQNQFGDGTIDEAIANADEALSDKGALQVREDRWKADGGKMAEEANSALDAASDPWFWEPGPGDPAEIPDALRSLFVAKVRVLTLKGDDLPAAIATAKADFRATYSQTAVGTGGEMVWRRNSPRLSYPMSNATAAEVDEAYEAQFVGEMNERLGRDDLTSEDLLLLPSGLADRSRRPKWPVALIDENGAMQFLREINEEGVMDFVYWWPDPDRIRADRIAGLRQEIDERVQGQARFRAEHVDLWMQSRLTGSGLSGADPASGRMRTIPSPDFKSQLYETGARLVGSSAEALGLIDTPIQVDD